MGQSSLSWLLMKFDEEDTRSPSESTLDESQETAMAFGAVYSMWGGGRPSIPVSSGRQAVSQYPPPNFRGLVLGWIEADFCK